MVPSGDHRVQVDLWFILVGRSGNECTWDLLGENKAVPWVWQGLAH